MRAGRSRRGRWKEAREVEPWSLPGAGVYSGLPSGRPRAGARAPRRTRLAPGAWTARARETQFRNSVIGQALISPPVQFFSNPAEGLEVSSQVGMADPLVDADHFLHKTEGLPIFPPLFMDQRHIMDRDRDS